MDILVEIARKVENYSTLFNFSIASKEIRKKFTEELTDVYFISTKEDKDRFYIGYLSLSKSYVWVDQKVPDMIHKSIIFDDYIIVAKFTIHGVLKEKITIENGVLHGEYVTMYDNYTEKSRAFYNNGKFTGNYQLYHDNGAMDVYTFPNNDGETYTYLKYTKIGKIMSVETTSSYEGIKEKLRIELGISF